MKKYGNELIFISQIDGNGLNVYPCSNYRNEIRDKQIFQINSLSLSNMTFIASGFNSYVVRLKNKQ